MIHVLFGSEAFLQHEKRQELLQGVDPFSISFHDMRETSLQTAIEDARTMDLFGEMKTVILRDCYFLTGENTRSKIEHDVDSLLSYIENPNPQTRLILMVQSDKLDKRKTVVKELLKVATVYEAKPVYNVQDWITKRFQAEGKKITRSAAALMAEQLGNDLFRLSTEIDKCVLRFNDAEEINDEMLAEVISRTLESDVFKLIDCIIRKQPSAMEILEDLYRLGEDPIKIVLLFARQFRMIHQVKVSQEAGEPPASVLKVSPFVLRIVEEQAEYYTLAEVQERLQMLADLDVAMKRGQVDKYLSLETMILEWL